MHQSNISNRIRANGFSLIEILIYLGLYSILFTGFISTIFVMQESASRVGDKADDARIALVIQQYARYKIENTFATDFTDPTLVSTTTVRQGNEAIETGLQHIFKHDDSFAYKYVPQSLRLQVEDASMTLPLSMQNSYYLPRANIYVDFELRDYGNVTSEKAASSTMGTIDYRAFIDRF